MKRISFYIGVVLAGMVLLASCRKKEIVDISNLPNLGGEIWPTAAIDQWIMDTLTVPYNLEVKYKFDRFEVADASLTKTLVPVKEELVTSVLRTIKKIWIDTYETEGGSAFIKTLIPKLIVLIGSPSYNVGSGSITLGEAEGGKKIILYDINTFNTSDRPKLVRMMHTIEHEFAHILHQTKYYSAEFKTITPGDYTGDWNQVTMAQANQWGFVTPYATSAPDEDFVETVATMLVEGKDYFEALVGAQDADGQAKLRAKESVVVNYYKDKWNIDFYVLQQKVKEALEEISPTPVIPLSDSFGYGKLYSSLKTDSSAGQTSQPYIAAFKEATALLAAYQSNAGRYIDSINFQFIKTDTLLLTVRYLNPNSPSSYYLANFRYPFTTNGEREITFGDVVVLAAGVTADGNARSIKNYVKPVTDFFGGKVFVPTWPDGKPDEGDIKIGGLYLKGDNGSYVLGTLGY